METQRSSPAGRTARSDRYCPLVPTARQVARRRIFERIWIVLGILWAVGRVIVAKATVEKYGVNIAVFAVIEILVAWPHALGAARVVTKLIDRDPTGAFLWGSVLAVTHIAPELYIAVTGSNMPAEIYVSLAVIVVGLGALAVVGIVQKVRAGRYHRSIAAQAARVRAVPVHPDFKGPTMRTAPVESATVVSVDDELTDLLIAGAASSAKEQASAATTAPSNAA